MKRTEVMDDTADSKSGMKGATCDVMDADAAASAYLSLWHDLFGWPPARKPMRFIFEGLGDIRNRTVVDMGCGEGQVSVFLAISGAVVVGLDHDEAKLKRAAALARKYGVGDRCRFISASAEQMPFGSGSVDAVLSSSTLQYMDRRRSLGECLRILAPGARLVLLENLPHNPFILVSRFLRRLCARSEGSRAYVRSIRGYITPQEILDLQSHFQVADRRFYYLLRSVTAAVLMRHPDWRVKSLDTCLEKVDRFVLDHVAGAYRLAWWVAFVGKGKI